MCPIPATCDQFVYWTDVRMYRERISISETACWLLFVFFVTKVASFVAEDGKGSGWCEGPGGACSRCLESNAVRCSGIADARLPGDLCGCCASCAVDRKLGESCGSQLSVRPLNIVDSWTAVLATSWCHKGLVCIDFVCRNVTVNEDPTVLTTRASNAGVQQSRISIEDIGSLEDSSFVGEDDRANFLLGENASPDFYRQAYHHKVHTTERARSNEEARSNAGFWRKLKPGLGKSQQETLTAVEASAYSTATNFISDQVDALTSPLATRIVQEDDEMMNDSEIPVAFARRKLKAIKKTLGSVLPPLEDGTTETMPKSDGEVNIRRRMPHARCASTNRSGNSTTITIGDREFRIIHGTDLMSDLKVLLDAIDHSELDSPRGDWTHLNTVSLLIDLVRDRCVESSTDNDLVGNLALSTNWTDRSFHASRHIFKAVEELPYDPARQESSTANVTSATTEDEQESSGSTVTNVTSATTQDGQESSGSTVTNVTSATTQDGQESSGSTVTNVTSATTQDGQESSGSTVTNVTSATTQDGQESSGSTVTNVTSATTQDGQESSGSTVTNVTSATTQDGQESSGSTVTNVTSATTQDGQESSGSTVTNVTSATTQDGQESSGSTVTNVTSATTQDGQESSGSTVTNVTSATTQDGQESSGSTVTNVTSATTQDGQESSGSTVTNVTSATTQDGQESSGSTVTNVTSATTHDGQESSGSTVTNVTSATTQDGQESSGSTVTNVTSATTQDGQESSGSTVTNVTSATTQDGQESSGSTVTNVTSATTQDGQESSGSTVTNVTSATTQDGQESSGSTVTNVTSATTQDGQESSGSTVTNVTSATTQDGQESSTNPTVPKVASPVLGGVSTTGVSPATLQSKIMLSTVFETASTIDTRLLTPEREVASRVNFPSPLTLPARFVASEDARTARTAHTTPATRIPSATARYKNTEEPETPRNSSSPNFAPVDRSLAKRPKRSRRGLAEVDADDYETNESVLRYDSLKNVEQLLSRDIEDRKSYEDSASPGISTRIHSSDQGVSSLYDEVYGEYPEDLVIFFDNDDSQNRSTNSVDIGRALTKVTDRGRGSGVTKRMPPLAEKQNVSGDLNAYRAIGNSPTSDDGRSSNGIPANRIPMRATSSPKLGEAQRVNATSLAIDDLFNRIETRMDGLERRIEGSVLKRCEPFRSQGLQDSHGLQSGRSSLQSEEVESRHEVPINESRTKTLRRAENVTVNGVARERNGTEIRRFGNRRRMGNHSNDRAKTILRSDLPVDAVPDEEFVADGHQRKRGRLFEDSAEAMLRNSTAQSHRRPMYARRRITARWRRPEEKRRRFHEEISAEGVGRLEYPEKNVRQHRESLGDRGSRRVARHSIWSAKALRSIPAAMNDDGPKTSRFCGQTQEMPGQGSSDDYPQAPRSLEVLRLESPSAFEAEAFDSKRVVPPPWRLFVSGIDGPEDRAKFAEEPAESRGRSSEWPYYAVTNRGNSSISIADAISRVQYEDIAAIHDDEDDFDHLYESVEANDDEDWTMMASVDSHDRIDYFDGIRSHMAPVLLEIYGASDITESDEAGIHPELAGIASTNGRTSRSASEDSVSFPNLHSPSDGTRSFSSPTPLVPPQRQKTRDPISRIWNSLSTAEPTTPNAASHRQTDSSRANFFADAFSV